MRFAACSGPQVIIKPGEYYAFGFCGLMLLTDVVCAPCR